MLTASEITAMRATANQALPDTCTIQRRTTTSDGGGGSSVTWANLTVLACRLAPLGGGEAATVGGRITDESTHVVTLPAGSDVIEADRLLIADQVYDVTLVKSRAAWELSRRVWCKEAV